MNTELSSKYDPSAVEALAYKVWMDEKCFHADPDKAGESYTIVIPPPNVTGALHLGHAINSTLQDILVRQHRMNGFNTLWVPGIDHAGIATQAVVEKQLKEQENKTRHDVGREGLVERIWTWKQQYGDRILEQLKRMGCSCDWDRTRFTLDDMCAKAVRETFFKLFKDGLIYRGKRLVNWDTFLQTSISDDEIYHETVKTSLWHIRYPIEDTSRDTGVPPVQDARSVEQSHSSQSEHDQHGRDARVTTEPRATHMIVATTRPETMLGDTAVAVHSEDPRWNWAIGKHVRLPLTNRLIPIIADDILVDPKFGTGVVKVTPAHDPNDYAVWQRHKGQADEIDLINILTPDGKITSDRPEWSKYAGMKRAAARTQVVEDLKAAGLLEKEEPYETQVGHSDRSKTPVEPYLSDQWFVTMKDLAEPALAAVSNGWIKFYPERHAQQYLSWLGEKRDWPVSRQLWWGHRIPVWTVKLRDPADGDEMAATTCRKIQRALDLIASKLDPGSAYVAHPRPVFIDGSVASISSARLGVPKLYDAVDICANSDAAGQRLEEVLQYFSQNLFRSGSVQPVQVPLQILPDEAETILLDTILPGKPEQDPDVLDTWFSSALWPHSTLGWPENTPELKKYYPTSVLLTGRDIITLWVARMVMMGMYNFRSQRRAWIFEFQNDAIRGSDRARATPLGPLLKFLSETQTSENTTIRHIRDGRYYALANDDRSEKALAALGQIIDPRAQAVPPEGPIPVMPEMNLIKDFNETAAKSARELRNHFIFFNEDSDFARIPFFDVAINPTILDGKGERMSKSKGNGVDPVDIIDSYGADALRFTLTKMATETQDARMPVKRDAGGKNTSEKFDEGRNFCNKLWNACRFALSNLEAVGMPTNLESPGPMTQVPRSEPSSDEDLMHRTQQGDKLAFTQVCERYSAAVHFQLRQTLGNPDDIESLVQEVFLRAFRFAATYQYPEEFSPWLTTITRNVAIHHSGPTKPAPTDADFSIPPTAVTAPPLTLVDRWIISRFHRTLEECNAALKQYRFDVYAKSCYDFFWRDFCDWYVEAIKPAMKDPARAPHTANVLAAVLDGSLRLMHPMIPFITETVWWRLNEVRPHRGLPGRLECPPSTRLVLAQWPNAIGTTDDADTIFPKLQELISAIRTIRNDYQVNPKQTVATSIKAPVEFVALIEANRELIELLGTCSLKTVRADLAPVANAVTASAAGCDIFVEGVIDPNAEKLRLTREIETKKKHAASMEARVDNEAYVAKAPPQVVQQTRDQLAAAKVEIAKMEESLRKLG